MTQFLQQINWKGKEKKAGKCVMKRDPGDMINHPQCGDHVCILSINKLKKMFRTREMAQSKA